MPGRIERTSGVRESPSLHLSRASRTRFQPDLSRAGDDGRPSQPAVQYISRSKLLGLYLRAAYPGYRSYGTSGYQAAEQGESPVHRYAEVGVLATKG